MFDALTAYSTRVAIARAAMSERSSSQEPPVSATAPIPTPPPITDEGRLPTVPSGWKAVYSVNDNAYYYWHLGTNHTQWEDPNITTVAVADVVDWAEPTATTGTASDSIWGPPPNTTWLPRTSSLPLPAPRSRWSSLTASDSSQP